MENAKMAAGKVLDEQLTLTPIEHRKAWVLALEEKVKELKKTVHREALALETHSFYENWIRDPHLTVALSGEDLDIAIKYGKKLIVSPCQIGQTLFCRCCREDCETPYKTSRDLDWFVVENGIIIYEGNEHPENREFPRHEKVLGSKPLFSPFVQDINPEDLFGYETPIYYGDDYKSEARVYKEAFLIKGISPE